MAPSGQPRQPDTSLPLADYFWIAGVDSAQLLEAYKPYRWSYDEHESLSTGSDHAADEIIEEDVAAEQENASPLPFPNPSTGHTRKSSYQRLSQLSGEARDAILNLEGGTNTRSNRSSATIRAVPSTGPRESALISDQDFDMAIKKFTSDRESFFLNLNFSQGTGSKPSRTKSRPRTQKITGEDAIPMPSSLPSRAMGSVRRHMSFKETTSFRRQPSNANRGVSTRTTKRISTYNSVVPRPQALDSSPDEHPLKRKFEPVLLDKYPRSDMVQEMSNRNPFPDYLPMFAFPNDISIISSDTRPRSVWHEFSMTAADNTKIPGICIILYIPLKRETADELEKRCEEWRRSNMTDAERELAASLAERLALERAKLSRLLTLLPLASQDSEAREELEDEISTVEEKISVMSDMLRPLRHGAASRIDGLTDGDTGLWIPRAYGILGRDSSMTGFWRQWLRAVSVPMQDGSILRVPASSPKVGMWQPIERYVHFLCSEAPSPISSKVQIDLAIRELHIFAKKEAINELPGSRTTDLYPLFRTLTMPNMVLLLEYVLSESRIILLSSHTAMLQLVSKIITEIIWPMKWCGVYIPVLPSRLIGALEAPCPYICGIERSYEKYDLPEDDFVLVDLDKNELTSTAPPPSMPKQIRRKLQALLHLASPIHHSFGIVPGPPAYAAESFPYDAFSVDTEAVFTAIAKSTNLARLVSLSSGMFGAQAATDTIRRPPTLNAFQPTGPTRGKSIERPRTASTSRQPSRQGSQPDTDQQSPVLSIFPQAPFTPTSRTDSGYALQTSLREKRSGHFDTLSKRNGSISGISSRMRHKASIPFVKHGSSPSNASMSPDLSGSTYAPSMYAQSTLAASTIMPGMVVQPARNTGNMTWVEGHCLQWRPSDGESTCVLCSERATEGFYRCSGCGFVIHNRCAPEITIVCPAAFYPDQIRAAFARCFAALFYTYKKFMSPANSQQKRNGRAYAFDVAAFQRSLPPDHAEYIEMMTQTQGFNEFIAERELATAAHNVQVQLFDNIIMAKRNRAGKFRQDIRSLAAARNPFGRTPGGSGRGTNVAPDVLNDTSTHQWRPMAAPSCNERLDLGQAAKGRDYHTVISRVPAKLEEELFAVMPAAESGKVQERRMPSLPKINGLPDRKMRRSLADPSANLRERLNGLSMNAPSQEQGSGSGGGGGGGGVGGERSGRSGRSGRS